MIRRLALSVAIALLLGGAVLIWSLMAREVMPSFATRLFPSSATVLQQLNPVPLATRLEERGFAAGQPVLLRLFKQENLLELWMRRGDRFELAMSFPICTWSGKLGPKLKEGDGQSPEGFYLVSARQLNPGSAYHRALNIGFPNAYDVALGRTGSFLMIHGSCVSVGCYAMTDAGIDDIYTAVELALQRGQEAVPVQIFPFRMTDQNIAAHRDSPWSDFWQNLAEGDRLFTASGQPPRAFACANRYGFTAEGDAAPAACTPITAW